MLWLPHIASPASPHPSLPSGGVDPSDVTVSLRCPSALAEFSKKDVQVLYNNHQVGVYVGVNS